MAKSFVLPHVLEKSGRITDTQFTFDTTIFMTYSKGLTDGKPSKGATVDLYLYDDAGSPMRSGGGQDVCNPCTTTLGNGAARKASISVDDLILAKGGFGATDVRTGFGVVIVSGDEKSVAIQGFVVNSHTGPFDLSFQPIDAEPVK